MTKHTCPKCTYVVNSGDGLYFCYRYPPQWVNASLKYPIVYQQNWCGEFKPLMPTYIEEAPKNG